MSLRCEMCKSWPKPCQNCQLVDAEDEAEKALDEVTKLKEKLLDHKMVTEEAISLIIDLQTEFADEKKYDKLGKLTIIRDLLKTVARS